MKASKKMFVFVLLSLAALLVSSVSISAVQAQQGTPSPNTLVTARGNFAYSGASVTSAQPSVGTGQQISASAMKDLQAKFAKEFPNGVSPNTIIGKNNFKMVSNTTTYPYRTIAYVYTYFPDGYSTDCTGFYVAPRLVATAAHCFFDVVHGAANAGWANYSDVWPGIQSPSFIPYGEDYSNWTISEGNFGSSLDYVTNQSPNGDWGIIQTFDSLGNTVGWLGSTSMVMPNNKYPGAYTLSGYPAPALLNYTQWWIKGPVKKVTTVTNPYASGIEGRLFYGFDTYYTDGSPMYYKHGTGFYAVGIDSYQQGLSPYPQYNSATRINADFFSMYSFLY